MVKDSLASKGPAKVGPVFCGKYDRSVLALELEPLYAAEAKRRMSEGGGDKKSGTQKSAEPIENKGETRDKLADLAGVT